MKSSIRLAALLLILPVVAGTLAAGSVAGPETADEVRARRAQKQLEENDRHRERVALTREFGELPEIDQALVDEFTEILGIIADPAMEGRVPGSRGIEDAAVYIESHLIELGLVPAFSLTETLDDGTDDGIEVVTPNGSFRQPMQMGTKTTAVTEMLTVGDESFTSGVDFSALSYSGSEIVSAPIVFTGYAIVSGPGDYLGFETDESVEGKIALCLNYEPMDEDGGSLWRDGKWSHNARLTYKISALERRGAAGVIIVSPPGAADDRVGLLESIDSTAPPANRMGKKSGPEYDIPVVHATAEVGAAILAYAGSSHSLDELIAMSNESGVVMPLGDQEIALGVELERTPMWTSNVGAILAGSGDLKDEYIVIGSHYDHVGYGKFGSGAPSRKGEVHPGADDNGTGTSANLIAAQLLVEQAQLRGADQDVRSILFLWFTAEESGLNGSRFYCEHPIVDIEQHVMMLNMDMVGTLSDGLLEIGGFDSADGFVAMAQPHLDASSIPYSEDVSVGSGRSDHASFDAVGIPNLFFFTGLHDRYHTPDDFVEFIDNEGCVRVAMLVSAMAQDAATRTDRLYHPMSKQEKPKKDGPNVRVGIIPSNSSKGGMMIERVFEDTSASDAGLRPGDRIVSWGDEELDSVEAWMPILTEQEPGMWLCLA